MVERRVEVRGVPPIAPIPSIVAAWPKHSVVGGVSCKVPSGIMVRGPGGAGVPAGTGAGGTVTLLLMPIAPPVAIWPVSPVLLHQGMFP